ncbi:MAG: hypothetical protein IMW89_05570 [Ktedonobacteraceae bacterium]|nr:hypothetical protein [Ktedonobacteraceae bacterium]
MLMFRRGLVLCDVILMGLMVGLLAGCMGPAGSGATATPWPSTIKIAKLAWCEKKPALYLRDEGAAVTPVAGGTVTTPSPAPLPSPSGTPMTINDWAVFKAHLGFTIYLPSELPAGTCLLSVAGTVRDPVLGSSLMIGFLLPDRTAISFSETPLRSQSLVFQCKVDTGQGGDTAKNGTAAATATAPPVQICTGVRDRTSIVFSARGTTGELRALFDRLQPDINWIPET